MEYITLILSVGLLMWVIGFVMGAWIESDSNYYVPPYNPILSNNTMEIVQLRQEMYQLIERNRYLSNSRPLYCSKCLSDIK
jgi:hypothetical protein